ncbi:chemotaxis protein CheW [Kurthia senegalensis]|uniref:chemotaxis protein CheW n=1 Tax=Kurthia senegalensis TaxID=1033740 RepID=UPI00028A0062|nr:chemotaxis protein CheW [Kurthia senegalensis]
MANEKVVVFRCGQEEYAISVDHIVSIEKMDRINRVPHLPSYMLGMTKNRGELVPVIDLEQILLHQTTEDEARLIMIQVPNFLFALRVNEAKEILDIEEDALKQIGLVNYAKTQYFKAVANLENRMITIIAPEILCDTLEGIKEIKAYVTKLKE